MRRAHDSIRDGIPADRPEISELLRAAFPSDDEAVLVKRLLDDGDVIASLVAVAHGKLAGHVLFSRLDLEGEGGLPVSAALAPLAVRPAFQRQGIGGALVRDGLSRCRELGAEAVIVVGDPDYYRRFGFSAALAERLESPFAGPAFMALELRAGALEGVGARVRYARAFCCIAEL